MPTTFLFDWPLSGWNKNQSNNSKVEACQEHPTVRGVSMTGETKPPFMREIMISEKLHASREFFKWKREKIPSQVNWTIFAAYLDFEFRLCVVLMVGGGFYGGWLSSNHLLLAIRFWYDWYFITIYKYTSSSHFLPCPPLLNSLKLSKFISTK